MNVQDVVLLITDGKPTYGLGWPNPPNVNIDASLQPQINQQVIDQVNPFSLAHSGSMTPCHYLARFLNWHDYELSSKMKL